jgi:hypothetical protein
MTDAMYIRFGEAPESGRSYHFDADNYEAGVSCYRADWQSTDHDVVNVYVPSDACIGTINEIQDRPVYLITGDLLTERGRDGDLLMANVTTTLVGTVEVVNFTVEEED